MCDPVQYPYMLETSSHPNKPFPLYSYIHTPQQNPNKCQGHKYCNVMEETGEITTRATVAAYCRCASSDPQSVLCSSDTTSDLEPIADRDSDTDSPRTAPSTSPASLGLCCTRHSQATRAATVRLLAGTEEQPTWAADLAARRTLCS